MISILPYKIVIGRKVIPWMNYIFLGTQVLIFCYLLAFPSTKLNLFILDHWSVTNILGYMWIHKEFLHLIMNLFFIWVFGNALCSSIGNIQYFFLYIMGGVIAAIGHLILDGRPSIGASGAIAALITAFCIFFPYRHVRTSILFTIVPIYKLPIAGVWYFLIYLFNQFIASLFGSLKIGYICHFSGIIGGALLAYLLIKFKAVNPETSNGDFMKSLRLDMAG